MTTLRDPIIIPTEQYRAVAPLVAQSALRHCTDVAMDAHSVIVTRRWPSLSTGEQILWDLLDSLVSGDLRRAADHLDEVNSRLVVQAIGLTYRAELEQGVAA